MDEIITVELKEYRAVPGTQLKIPLSIRNITQQADSLELTFQGIPLSWITLPAPVVSLLAGEQKMVDILLNIPPVPEIQAGYHSMKITATSQKDPAIKGEIDIKLALAVFESHGRIGVMMKSVQFSVAPGDSLTIPITVLNHGLVADTFHLGVEGIPADWASTLTPVSPLDPGESKEIALVVRPPLSPSSEAGRKKFRLVLTSQEALDQVVKVDCVLNLMAYTKFSAKLDPDKIEAGQPVRVNVQNEGNTQRVFQLIGISQNNQLIFDYLQPETAAQPARPPATGAEGQMNDPTFLPIPPGASAAFRFSVRPRQRPLLGGTVSYPYQVSVGAKQAQAINLFGQLLSRGMIPVWVLPIVLVLCCCLILASGILILQNTGQSKSASQTSAAGTAMVVNMTQGAMAGTAVSASVTQTIIANQTAAAATGQEDSDGDGLTNDREKETNTDPANPDSDGDGLLDGEEVFQSGTNPLVPDSDGDGLTDGDEIRRRTNPLSVDTDGDHLGDGDEVNLGTNPLNPDTDGDGLIDGNETLPCPSPLNPDSDGDGIIDGRDISPCDPNNPILTATAAAIQATATPVPPTQTPIPTSIPATLPIQLPSVTPTQVSLPSFNGMVLFESDRDGNLEIYTVDSAGHLRRLTDNPYADFQAAWQPGLQRLAFTTNRNGQNEIYLMNADGTNLINLTNNPADDQYPTWSEDGEWIAFSSNRNGNYEIYKLRVSNYEIQNLTNNPANDTQPDWVRSPTMDPSDEYLVFTSDRDGNLEIYRMKTDGTGIENLTVNPASDQMAKGSSDGSLVVFTTNRDGNQEIYYMRRDGKSLVNLTNNPANDYGATWSPADVWFGFTTERNGNREVYIMKPGTTELYNLTNHPYQDTASDWR